MAALWNSFDGSKPFLCGEYSSLMIKGRIPILLADPDPILVN